MGNTLGIGVAGHEEKSVVERSSLPNVEGKGGVPGGTA